MVTIGLLAIANIFMTIAWYGHLKFPAAPLWSAILISWGIAFIEYCFMIPANRIGHNQFSVAQLGTIQEVIRLCAIIIFSAVCMQEEISWNITAGFLCMGVGAVLIFTRI